MHVRRDYAVKGSGCSGTWVNQIVLHWQSLAETMLVGPFCYPYSSALKLLINYQPDKIVSIAVVTGEIQADRVGLDQIGLRIMKSLKQRRQGLALAVSPGFRCSARNVSILP